MKLKDLKVLIKECYSEVLQEYSTQTPSYDAQSKENTDVIKISKQDPQKQQKIVNAQKNKQSYELYEEENQVNEMARVPKVYSLGPNAEKAESKLSKHPKVLKVIDYIKQNGPSNIKKIVDEFGWRQQQFNPLVMPLVDAGILKDEGLKWEPKNPAKVRSIKTHNDDGEELFDDEIGKGEDSWQDLFVGFSDKYDYIPRKNEEDEDEDEIFDEEPPKKTTPEEEDELKYEIPDEGSNLDDLGDWDNIDNWDDEEDEIY